MALRIYDNVCAFVGEEIITWMNFSRKAAKLS